MERKGRGRGSGGGDGFICSDIIPPFAVAASRRAGALFFFPLIFFHAIKQLKLWKIPTLSKQAGKQRPYCGFLFGPAKNLKPRMCTACPPTHTHSPAHYFRPLVLRFHFHKRPRETVEAPSPSVITGLATLSDTLPSCNIIAASPRKVLKELIQWSGLGAGAGGALSVYTASGGRVRLRQDCN